jgi:hypothetical protein
MKSTKKNVMIDVEIWRFIIFVPLSFISLFQSKSYILTVIEVAWFIEGS